MNHRSGFPARQALLIANGDLRLSANQKCWHEQARMEKRLAESFAAEGWRLTRAHPVDPVLQHGFISSQKMGLEVFRALPPQAPLVVAESVWQYSQHILPGLFTHQGPILTVANWSGAWPGLVGLLNLNGSLTKMGVRYSSIWSERFSDGFYRTGLRSWLRDRTIRHDCSHVREFRMMRIPPREEEFAVEFGRRFVREKAIMGVFDEGCMGMHNAIIPDELLNKTGVFKERLSQSTLYAAMQQVSEAEARDVLNWLRNKGMTFRLGPNEETDLTESQVLTQCRMYVAALRLADEFGCATIGIQYQQGLKDLTPASDLVEGLLNNTDRPPVRDPFTRRVLFKGEPLPHFNEVDECAGLDGLVTARLWRALGFPPENTLHDLRWGRRYAGPAFDPALEGRAGRPSSVEPLPHALDDYVWVFLISGAAPPAHFVGGYRGAVSERQPAMYFRLGGGTLKGVSKPGFVVWSRVFVMDQALHCDIGVARVVGLPAAETEARWKETTPQWPIMHAVLEGITRDQMMARHQSNHIQVVYAPSQKQAHRAARIKAMVMQTLGLQVHLCGNVAVGPG